MFRINSNKVACYDDELDRSLTFVELNRLSKIDIWFLAKLRNIIQSKNTKQSSKTFITT